MTPPVLIPHWLMCFPGAINRTLIFQGEKIHPGDSGGLRGERLTASQSQRPRHFSLAHRGTYCAAHVFFMMINQSKTFYLFIFSTPAALNVDRVRVCFCLSYFKLE